MFVSTQLPVLLTEYLSDSVTHIGNVIAAMRLVTPALFSDPVRFKTVVFFFFFFINCPLSLCCSTVFPQVGFEVANISQRFKPVWVHMLPGKAAVGAELGLNRRPSEGWTVPLMVLDA